MFGWLKLEGEEATGARGDSAVGRGVLRVHRVEFGFKLVADGTCVEPGAGVMVLLRGPLFYVCGVCRFEPLVIVGDCDAVVLVGDWLFPCGWVCVCENRHGG